MATISEKPLGRDLFAVSPTPETVNDDEPLPANFSHLEEHEKAHHWTRAVKIPQSQKDANRIISMWRNKQIQLDAYVAATGAARSLVQKELFKDFRDRAFFLDAGYHKLHPGTDLLTNLTMAANKHRREGARGLDNQLSESAEMTFADARREGHTRNEDTEIFLNNEDKQTIARTTRAIDPLHTRLQAWQKFCADLNLPTSTRGAAHKAFKSCWSYRTQQIQNAAKEKIREARLRSYVTTDAPAHAEEVQILPGHAIVPMKKRRDGTFRTVKVATPGLSLNAAQPATSAARLDKMSVNPHPLTPHVLRKLGLHPGHPKAGHTAPVLVYNHMSEPKVMVDFTVGGLSNATSGRYTTLPKAESVSITDHPNGTHSVKVYWDADASGRGLPTDGAKILARIFSALSVQPSDAYYIYGKKGEPTKNIGVTPDTHAHDGVAAKPAARIRDTKLLPIFLDGSTPQQFIASGDSVMPFMRHATVISASPRRPGQGKDLGSIEDTRGKKWHLRVKTPVDIKEAADAIRTMSTITRVDATNPLELPTSITSQMGTGGKGTLTTTYAFPAAPGGTPPTLWGSVAHLHTNAGGHAKLYNYPRARSSLGAGTVYTWGVTPASRGPLLRALTGSAKLPSEPQPPTLHAASWGRPALTIDGDIESNPGMPADSLLHEPGPTPHDAVDDWAPTATDNNHAAHAGNGNIYAHGATYTWAPTMTSLNRAKHAENGNTSRHSATMRGPPAPRSGTPTTRRGTPAPPAGPAKGAGKTRTESKAFQRSPEAHPNWDTGAVKHSTPATAAASAKKREITEQDVTVCPHKDFERDSCACHLHPAPPKEGGNLNGFDRRKGEQAQASAKKDGSGAKRMLKCRDGLNCKRGTADHPEVHYHVAAALWGSEMPDARVSDGPDLPTMDDLPVGNITVQFHEAGPAYVSDPEHSVRDDLDPDLTRANSGMEHSAGDHPDLEFTRANYSGWDLIQKPAVAKTPTVTHLAAMRLYKKAGKAGARSETNFYSHFRSQTCVNDPDIETLMYREAGRCSPDIWCRQLRGILELRGYHTWSEAEDAPPTATEPCSPAADPPPGTPAESLPPKGVRSLEEPTSPVDTLRGKPTWGEEMDGLLELPAPPYINGGARQAPDFHLTANDKIYWAERGAPIFVDGADGADFHLADIPAGWGVHARTGVFEGRSFHKPDARTIVNRHGVEYILLRTSDEIEAFKRSVRRAMTRTGALTPPPATASGETAGDGSIAAPCAATLEPRPSSKAAPATSPPTPPGGRNGSETLDNTPTTTPKSPAAGGGPSGSETPHVDFLLAEVPRRCGKTYLAEKYKDYGFVDADDALDEATRAAIHAGADPHAARLLYKEAVTAYAEKHQARLVLLPPGMGCLFPGETRTFRPRHEVFLDCVKSLTRDERKGAVSNWQTAHGSDYEDLTALEMNLFAYAFQASNAADPAAPVPDARPALSAYKDVLGPRLAALASLGETAQHAALDSLIGHMRARITDNGTHPDVQEHPYRKRADAGHPLRPDQYAYAEAGLRKYAQLNPLSRRDYVLAAHNELQEFWEAVRSKDPDAIDDELEDVLTCLWRGASLDVGASPVDYFPRHAQKIHRRLKDNGCPRNTPHCNPRRPLYVGSPDDERIDTVLDEPLSFAAYRATLLVVGPPPETDAAPAAEPSTKELRAFHRRYADLKRERAFIAGGGHICAHYRRGQPEIGRPLREFTSGLYWTRPALRYHDLPGKAHSHTDRKTREHLRKNRRGELHSALREALKAEKKESDFLRPVPNEAAAPSHGPDYAEYTALAYENVNLPQRAGGTQKKNKRASFGEWIRHVLLTQKKVALKSPAPYGADMPAHEDAVAYTTILGCLPAADPLEVTETNTDILTKIGYTHMGSVKICTDLFVWLKTTTEVTSIKVIRDFTNGICTFNGNARPRIVKAAKGHEITITPPDGTAKKKAFIFNDLYAHKTAEFNNTIDFFWVWMAEQHAHHERMEGDAAIVPDFPNGGPRAPESPPVKFSK